MSRKTPGLNKQTRVRYKCLAVTYSHMGNPTLPSAMYHFTAEFGMESGGSNTLMPPGKLSFQKYSYKNDMEGTAEVIRQVGDELAAVIVEPVLGAGGSIPGSTEYLERYWTRNHLPQIGHCR